MKNKLIPFIGKEWFKILEPVFEKHWDVITKKIIKEKQPITPLLKHILKPYKECTPDKLNVVILGSNPYKGLDNNKPIADGLAFSSANSTKPQFMLKELWKAWNEDYNQWSRSTDLTYLANQGVLLINASLTTVVGTGNNHEHIWTEFTKDCLKALNNHFTGIHYIFIGETQIYNTNISYLDNWVYNLSYPEYETWDYQNVFKKINNRLKDKNLNEIRWIN